jgi:cytidylate kinase
MSGHFHSLDDIVEHEALRHELQTRSEETAGQQAHSVDLLVESKPAIKPYITLSRQFGCPAKSIAESLAERLGWTAYDREIVDEISRRSGVFHTEVEALDGKVNTQLRDYIASLPFIRLFSQETYHHYLRLTLEDLASKGGAIFLDRGANFILPSRQGLRIRFTAPLVDRLAAVSAYRELSTRAIRDLVVQRDEEQAAFIEYHFSHDVEDPHAYDAVLDLSRLTASEVQDTVLSLLKSKLGVRALDSGHQTPDFR